MALVALGLTFPSPTPAAPLKGKLALERPTGRILVQFAPPAHGAREGFFSLLLRNTSPVPLRPRLTLDPDADIPVMHLHLFGKTKGPLWLRSIGRVPRIRPHGVARLALAVRLPAGGDPGLVDGKLVLQAVTSSLRPVGKAVLVSIASIGLKVNDARPVPTRVVLHPTGWLPDGNAATGTEAAFEVRGLDAETLVGSGRLETEGLLHSSDGHSVPVQVTTRRKGDKLQPVLRLIGSVEAGTYTGTVPLSHGAQSPTVAVTVVARDAIVWALVAVALGTFLGGLLPLLGKRARKRNVLRARLQGILIEYFAADSVDSEMRWFGLSEEIGGDRVPWTSTEWLAEPDLHGAAGLFSQLRWAENDGELAELKEKVDKLIARIARWLQIQAKVALLAQLAKEKMPAIDGTTWSMTQTAKDSENLRRQLAETEPSPSEVEAKLELLARQAYWQAEVAEQWRRVAKASEMPHVARAALLKKPLGKLLELPSPATDKSRAVNWTTLERKLNSLCKLIDDATGLASSRLARRPALTSDALTPKASFKRQAIDWLASLKPRARTRLERTLVRTKPARIMAAARRQDLMLSIIAALGAMLVYVLQIYTSTWGSFTDYLSAVAAGFGAQVIVRWGSLPIFESWQGGNAPKTADAQTPGGKPSGRAGKKGASKASRTAGKAKGTRSKTRQTRTSRASTIPGKTGGTAGKASPGKTVGIAGKAKGAGARTGPSKASRTAGNASPGKPRRTTGKATGAEGRTRQTRTGRASGK